MRNGLGHTTNVKLRRLRSLEELLPTAGHPSDCVDRAGALMKIKKEVLEKLSK